MRTFFITFGVIAILFFSAYHSERFPLVGAAARRATAERDEQARLKVEFERAKLRDREARKAARTAAATRKIDEALARLATQGVTREDVKDYFYEEIAEDVRDTASQ